MKFAGHKIIQSEPPAEVLDFGLFTTPVLDFGLSE